MSDMKINIKYKFHMDLLVLGWRTGAQRQWRTGAHRED